MTVWICRTCAVEHPDTAEPPGVCEICADERQWVPAEGQQWTTLEQLREGGHAVVVEELETDLLGLTVSPKVGIGQRAAFVRTPAGNLLWDPIGYLDDAAVERLRDLGPVAAVAASHPHMFGVQVEWARALDAPVLVNAADKHWLARHDHIVRLWSGTEEIAPGLTLHQLGGHFPGSAVALWEAGAEGAGVLLSGDTVFPTPDRRSVAFMRSYPNFIPLSMAVTERLARDLEQLTFDRIYGNFGIVPGGAKEVVRRSAERHIAWARGDHDEET